MGVPIVRSTTIYSHKAREFEDIQYSIMNEIKREVYEFSVKTMEYYSDLELDLAKDLYISCYSDGMGNRKLLIRNKNTRDNEH